MTYYTTDASGQITAASPGPEFLTDPKQTDEEIVYGYDGKLYLASQCPPTPPPTPEELAAARRTEILAELEAIDAGRIRPLAELALEPGAEFPGRKLAELERRAAELRADLAELAAAETED